MSADNCWKIFQNKLKEVSDVIDDSYRARLENDYDTLQKQLANINRQLEDINPDTGKTYLDEFLESISVVRNQKTLDAMAGELTALKNKFEMADQIQDTYNHLKTLYKGTKKTNNKILQDAITSHIYNTNFTYNTNPIELFASIKDIEFDIFLILIFGFGLITFFLILSQYILSLDIPWPYAPTYSALINASALIDAWERLIPLFFKIWITIFFSFFPSTIDHPDQENKSFHWRDEPEYL